MKAADAIKAIHVHPQGWRLSDLDIESREGGVSIAGAYPGQQYPMFMAGDCWAELVRFCNRKSLEKVFLWRVRNGVSRKGYQIYEWRWEYRK